MHTCITTYINTYTSLRKNLPTCVLQYDWLSLVHQGTLCVPHHIPAVTSSPNNKTPQTAGILAFYKIYVIRPQ